MKLYDVPQRKGIKIRIINDASHPPEHREFEENEILTFNHMDGFYSLCADKNGNPVHLGAMTEVEIVNGEENE